MRGVDRGEGLAQRTDLVDLHQDGIADAVLDAVGEPRQLVTKRSSPTSWKRLPIISVSCFQPS